MGVAPLDIDKSHQHRICCIPFCRVSKDSFKCKRRAACSRWQVRDCSLVTSRHVCLYRLLRVGVPQLPKRQQDNADACSTMQEGVEEGVVEGVASVEAVTKSEECGAVGGILNDDILYEVFSYLPLKERIKSEMGILNSFLLGIVRAVVYSVHAVAESGQKMVEVCN